VSRVEAQHFERARDRVDEPRVGNAFAGVDRELPDAV
jgi:hypothetical protein